VDGTVLQGLEPLVPLIVIPPNGDPVEIIATVDTGSTGELTLPPSAIRDLALKLLRSDNAILADGSKVSAEVYEALVLWLDEVRAIAVYEMDGTPLLGMKLMRGCRLAMDIIPDGQFTITQIQATQE
jgi:clan AA aspartic protease